MDETDDADTIIRPRDVLLVEGGEPVSAAVAPKVLHRDDLEGETIVRDGAVPVAKGRASPLPGSLEHPPAAPVSAHRVSINGAEPVLLDVPCFVGRKPRLPRVVPGTVPRLVTVPSVSGEVSGTHLELSQVGASIVITDLRSTNGTRVTMPGAVPLRLQSGQSLVAVPGTIIEIGDGNAIEILLPPRLSASGISMPERVR